jgi:hypothetical protein
LINELETLLDEPFGTMMTSKPTSRSLSVNPQSAKSHVPARRPIRRNFSEFVEVSFKRSR